MENKTVYLKEVNAVQYKEWQQLLDKKYAKTGYKVTILNEIIFNEAIKADIEKMKKEVNND